MTDTFDYRVGSLVTWRSEWKGGLMTSTVRARSEDGQGRPGFTATSPDDARFVHWAYDDAIVQVVKF